MRAIIMIRLEKGGVFPMIKKKELKTRFLKAVFGCFLVMMGIFGAVASPMVESAYAVPANNSETTEVEEAENANNNSEANENSGEEEESQDGADGCRASMKPIGWIVCPITEKTADAVDWLYDKIEGILTIDPVSMENGSPIYEVWKYCRGLTNIVFIIFLLVVIYSQITGYGISNYGIKKALPKLIVSAVMVNLSFLICSLAVDASNIVGNSLRGLFTSIAEATTFTGDGLDISFGQIFGSLVGGGALAVGAGMIAFELGAIWMLIPVLLGALVAVASGLITIALRQAVVMLLIMISPLAFVAYILPNTDKWFKKWKDLFFKMLIFYPMFSLLFGASHLAGVAIIASAQNMFGVLLGLAVQIFPLFFCWSLMKMSGTFLGDINTKLRGMAATPLAANRAWAGSHRAQTQARRMQYGGMPFNRLQRYLDNRKALREQNTDSLAKLRSHDANIYAQRKISAGYNGAKAQGTEDFLKPNKYTRVAKDLSNAKLASETATMDTAHVISNYSNYFVDKDIRDRVKVATKAKDGAALDNLRKTDAEYNRAALGAFNYLEYSRAQMTAENDSEADFNYMVSEYLDANINRGKDDKAMERYRHYIESSAGGLGEIGSTRVLGKIIAKAAAVESSQRRDINIIANKYPPDKRSFRNMVVGYYVNDDGIATDKDGNEIESFRGELLATDPDKLVLWDQSDENGPYYEWKDSNGKFVTKIYKKDKSAIKELMSNFDAPINDPINNLYGVLAGIKPGQIQGTKPELANIGLEGYRTTIGRALLSAPFKEKNAAFSPMVKEMVSKGYITNYAQEYLAYLDSLNKATKPGAFNVQDADAVKMFSTIMNPTKWEEIFPLDLIRGYKNVNGEPIYGIRYEDGNEIKVPAEEATWDELMNRVKKKFIYPAAKKMTMMMSKQTPNMADNQKAGTIEAWNGLKGVFDEYWGDGKMVEVDPYEQSGDMRKLSSEVRQSLYIKEGEERVPIYGPKGKRGSRRDGSSGYLDIRGSRSDNLRQHVNHHVIVDDMHINSNGDPDEFARSFVEHCDNYPELERVKRDFKEFVADHKYMATEEMLYDFAIELLDSYTNLD